LQKKSRLPIDEGANGVYATVLLVWLCCADRKPELCSSSCP